ncbi:hypothetical protein [Streptosporangium sp. KLBMP 9127]|nr:hypothetical protein [Streptosporangium sp. KLBMP 9127]
MRHQAVLDLFAAMCVMPDLRAVGILRAAVLDSFARDAVYVYSPVLIRIRRDARTGGLLVEGADGS